MDYREQYDRYVAMIEETIEKILPQTETDCPNDMQIPRHLCEAMRYSLLAGGKRVRPAAAGGMRYVGRRYQPGARPCRGAGNDSYLFIDS
mgnify:CR=1 FL=1